MSKGFKQNSFSKIRNNSSDVFYTDKFSKNKDEIPKKKKTKKKPKRKKLHSKEVKLYIE